MRLGHLVLATALSGCVGAGASGGSRPGVMPLLSELPADATKRDAVLDAANTVAGPEHRRGMTKKERAAETAAATAAAILGSLFSSTPSVTLGTVTPFDDTALIAPDAAPKVRPSATKADASASPPASDANGDPAKPAPADASNTDLLPWVKLK